MKITPVNNYQTQNQKTMSKNSSSPSFKMHLSHSDRGVLIDIIETAPLEETATLAMRIFRGFNALAKRFDNCEICYRQGSGENPFAGTFVITDLFKGRSIKLDVLGVTPPQSTHRLASYDAALTAVKNTPPEKLSGHIERGEDLRLDTRNGNAVEICKKD